MTAETMLRAAAETLIFLGALGVLVTGFMLLREDQERRSRLRRRRGR